MAKLARLMPPDPSYLIEPDKLALSARELAGEIPLADMTRLDSLAETGTNTAEYRLRFGRTDKGIIQVAGEIRVRLRMECQRCLNRMPVDLDIQVNTGVVKDQEEAGLLDDELEPHLAEDREISLLWLIEEEILLSLPIAVMHNEDECPASVSMEQHRPRSENPFAVLKKLKNVNQNQE